MEPKSNTEKNKNENSPEKLDSPIIYLMLGGAFLSLIHQWMRSTLPEDRRWITYLFFGIGFMLFIIGTYCVEKKRTPGWLTKLLSAVSGYLRISQNQFVSLFFAIALSITGTIAGGPEAQLYNPIVSMLSWAGSIVLIVMAGWEKKLIALRPWNRALLLALGLFVIALLLRAINTSNYPSALSGDEASSGIFSVSFIKGLTNNLFNVGWFSFPALYFFIQSIGIRILGQTIPGLRITAAIVGSLSVLTLFLVVRAMFDDRTAFISSILLACSHYHIHFSRIGLNNIWDGLSYIVTLGALWFAWNRERKAAFILAGISLGLSQYFYTSARGLLAVVPVWLIFVAVQDKKRFKRLLPDIILMVIATFIVILPLAWFFLQHPDEFQAPMTRVAVLGDWLIDRSLNTGMTIWEVLGNQFTASLLAFTDKPLQFWYTPGTPMLRPISAWIFYLSIGLLMFKFKDNRVWLVFLWLGFFVIAGALSESTPAAQRYIASIPACLIVVGYGVKKIIDLLEQLWGNHKKLISNCALVFVLLVAMDDARFYFFDYSPKSDFGGYHTQISQRLANYLQDYDSSWEVIFTGWPEMGYYSISSLSYLAPQIKGVDIFKPWGDPENAVPDYKNILFVFLPVRELDLHQCMEQYPGGKLITEYDHDQMLFYLYKVQIP